MRRRQTMTPKGRCHLRDFLFWLCGAWTVSQMMVLFLLAVGVERIVLPPLMPYYNFVLILVYVAVKEGARWVKKRLGKKKGEYFFYAWWIYALVLMEGSALSGGRTTVPTQVLINCILVSVAYLLSWGSKITYALSRMTLRARRKHTHGTHDAACKG